ncbi:MAG: TetR/AcrR family transcriptional regulator [Armatimonadetes bacterium]|nr:MAG: TetR/AcrR family transcriptional regulator [Armatimonadota bacterium]
MSPEDRQQAILDAVTPLIVERGASVTTSEMARAAGVAEGTIYSVFPDKHSLIIAAVRASLDPAAVQAAVGNIDRTQTLQLQLQDAATILADRIERVMALFDALRSLPEHSHHDGSHARHFVAQTEAAVTETLTELLDTHREELSIEPVRAAAAFRGLIFAIRHPMLPPDQRLTVEEAVTILMSGITNRPVTTKTDS